MRDYRLANDRGRLVGQLFGERTWVPSQRELRKEHTSELIKEQMSRMQSLVKDMARKTMQSSSQQSRRRGRKKKQSAFDADPTFVTLRQLQALDMEEDGEVRCAERQRLRVRWRLLTGRA